MEKYSNTKFHETLSSGRRVVPCGRRDGQDEVFRNFVNTPKNWPTRKNEMCIAFVDYSEYSNKVQLVVRSSMPCSLAVDTKHGDRVFF
jgi:hypothetical protein